VEVWMKLENDSAFEVERDNGLVRG